MSIPRVLVVLGLMASAAWAQDGIMATAVRLVTIPPTEARISISVQTDTTKTLDDVLNRLKDARVGVEHLVNVTSQEFPAVPGVPGAPRGIAIYTFQTLAPLANTQALIRQIGSLTPPDPAITARASLAGVQPSQAAIEEARARLFPDLFQEAKARAEKMASDAGLSAGKVLGLTDGSLGLASFAGFLSSSQATFIVGVRLQID